MTSNSLNQNWTFLVSGEYVIVSALNPFYFVCRLYVQETEPVLLVATQNIYWWFIDPDVMTKSHLSEQQKWTLCRTGHWVLLYKRCLCQSVADGKCWKPGSLSDRHCLDLTCVSLTSGSSFIQYLSYCGQLLILFLLHWCRCRHESSISPLCWQDNGPW